MREICVDLSWTHRIDLSNPIDFVFFCVAAINAVIGVTLLWRLWRGR